MNRVRELIERWWSMVVKRSPGAIAPPVSPNPTRGRPAQRISAHPAPAQGARKQPPVYLVFPPGAEGRRKRAFLGLDDEEHPDRF